jgi:hypothetical protein
MKVAEEYGWVITQTAGPSRYDQSGSNVLEFGFQLESLIYTLYLTIRKLSTDMRRTSRNVTIA